MKKRLAQSTVRPTLNAVAGDLSLCLPKRQLDNIVETLAALDKIAPGTMNYDTLLYGVECKYYSARPDCTDFELDGCEKIYAVGDGTGFTRSLQPGGRPRPVGAWQIKSCGIKPFPAPKRKRPPRSIPGRFFVFSTDACAGPLHGLQL